MKNVLLLFLIAPVFGFGQITGTIKDKVTKEPVFGAKITALSGEKALSDIDGKFSISPATYPATLIISAQTYNNDTVRMDGPGKLDLEMSVPVQDIKTVVVTAGRRDQDIEDVSVSMEIIRPDLFDNKGLANIEEAVDLSPGVYAMDGQVSIRGGSGFAYGAGSRVLLLWNGIPVLSGDAGDAKWNSIPMECAAQIEILKGASSVLYGSGALNGIISLSEREPSLKGETRLKIQGGIYGNPRRESLKWWSSNPTFYQAEAYYGKMKKRFGYTISVNGFTNEGYRHGETEDRARVSGTLFFRPEKAPKLKAGVGYNFQYQKTGNFIIWESDTLAYTPNGGADTSLAESSLTYNTGIRFSIDPYVKLFDRNNNLHTVKTRYYLVRNDNVTNDSQSATSGVIYGDYQFQHRGQKGGIITSGATVIRTDVNSNLFGNHFSNNMAAYAQYEHHLNKLDLTGGVRLEHFSQDGRTGDSDFYLNRDSTAKLPVYPIFRMGAHYQVAKFTHLRASFGQGIRYPSVAERYTQTAVGALLVFPNPELRPETGWAAELGVKQAVKIGKSWKGLLDVAGFINQYSNMMEFTFGQFKPDSIPWSLNPDDPGYINKWFGFQARNAEKARITGLEVSFSSQGKIKEVELTSLIGYTYMNPISLNTDSAYVATFSDSGSNILKYRFNHLVKFDVQAEWKGFSLGATARYNSFMSNIDAIFENEIVAGVTILPGLKEYRQRNNKGAFVVDTRLGYKFKDHYRVGFIVNNIFNREYVTRPGDVQPPRNFILQLQMNF